MNKKKLDELSAEYIRLLADKLLLENERNADERVKDLQEHIDELIMEKGQIEQFFKEKIKPLADRMTEIKKAFADAYDGEHKTIQTAHLIAKISETKVTTVVDSEKAVAFLVANGKVPEGVKSFNMPFMRKARETGFIDDDVVLFTKNVNVKLIPNKDGDAE